MSVPVISDGMRSGVNWMRLKSRSRISASVLMSSVLARPGTPTSRQWPREKSAVRTSSMTLSWPTITLPISASMASRFAANSSIAAISLSFMAVDSIPLPSNRRLLTPARKPLQIGLRALRLLLVAERGVSVGQQPVDLRIEGIDLERFLQIGLGRGEFLVRVVEASELNVSADRIRVELERLLQMRQRLLIARLPDKNPRKFPENNRGTRARLQGAAVLFRRGDDPAALLQLVAEMRAVARDGGLNLLQLDDIFLFFLALDDLQAPDAAALDRLELLGLQEILPLLLESGVRLREDLLDRLGRRPAFDGGEEVARRVLALAVDEKIDGGSRLGVGELHLLGRFEINQRGLHFLEADEAVFLERVHEQRLVRRREIIERGFRPVGPAPERLIIARHAFVEPDRRLVVARADDHVVNVFMAQGIEPAVALEQHTRRDDHHLVELADADGAGLFDVASRQRRDAVEGERVGGDLDAHFLGR